MGSVYDSFSNPTGMTPFAPQTGLWGGSAPNPKADQLRQMLAQIGTSNGISEAHSTGMGSPTNEGFGNPADWPINQGKDPSQWVTNESSPWNNQTAGSTPQTPNFNVLPQGGSPTNSPYGNPIWTNPFAANSPSNMIAPPPPDPTSGVRGNGQSGPGVPTDPRTAGMTPPAPTNQNPRMGQGVGGALGSTFAQLNSPEFAAQVKAAQEKARLAGVSPTGQAPVNPLAPNAQQQNWLKDNEGLWGNFAKQFIGGQGQNGTLDPMNIDWTNFSNGSPEHITRALGVVNQNGGDALAKMLGGTLVDSPFATFGTNQKDRFIKMPNGQMIDASAMQNSLNGVKNFDGLTDILNMYKRESNSYNPQTSMDAQALVQRGQLNPTTPPGWNPSSFAGGNPTYAPVGAAQGNPSNPGMGTSNPVQFQGGQINAYNGQNGFPMFNYSNPSPTLPNNGLYPPQTIIGGGASSAGSEGGIRPPGGAPQTPQAPTITNNTNNNNSNPTGQNSNWQYYLNGGGGSGNGAAPGGMGGGATTNNTSGMGSVRGGRYGGDALSQPKTTNSWTGSLPNGAGSVGK